MNGELPDPRRWDVVVFRTPDTHDAAYDREFHANPPIIARVDIGYAMYIERLDNAVVQKVNGACSAGGIENMTAHRYSFVRWFPDGVDPRHFDEDKQLQLPIVLSRLVRPTSIGLEESAQVHGSMRDPDHMTVTPGPITGPASGAYVADRSRADWLTPTDAVELRTLIDVYYRMGLPPRVQRGLWHHEFAARALDAAARWTSIVTGLEALFSTDKDFVSRQFKNRCVGAATELGIPLTRRQADDVYRQRSTLSHGTITHVGPGLLDLYYVNKGIANLSHLRDLGHQVNRKLLEVERVSHRCVLTQDALDWLQSPTVAMGQRVSALRFGDPRVMALLQAITGFSHVPQGFRNRDLRPQVDALLGRPYTRTQMTYDLRRLRLKGVIHRIPKTHRYTATTYGLKVAFFYSKLYLRILRPQWNALLPASDHLPRPLRIALDQLDAEIQKLHEEAALAA